MEYFSEFGYLGLFIAAFLAATILPLSSEIVLSTLLMSHLSPISLITVATIGNVLGSLVNYALGYWSRSGILKRWFKTSEEKYIHAEKRFEKYGLYSLLFSWVPIIGDPLTVIAGLLRVRLLWFVLLVTAGKLIRYIVVTNLALEAKGLF